MKIILKHEIYSIKNGFAAHSPEIGLTAHGHSPEIAKKNLERTAVMFMQPFQREGTLRDVINRMKIRTEGEVGRDFELIATVE
jgi:hypothetical protein